MITFIKEPNKTVENAFNNQVFEFESPTGIKCRLVISNGINSTAINIDAIANKFYLNARDAVLSLFNKDNFADDILPTASLYLFNDFNLYREFDFEFTVTNLNGTTDTVTKTIGYLKAVQHLHEVWVNNFDFKILSNNTWFNYYNGLPFDISIFSATNRTITIENKRNAISSTFDLTTGVNRLFLSNGETNNFGFESVIPIVIGHYNNLVFSDGGNELASIQVYKHDVCDAPYLKWFNKKGGWSYHRFSPIYRKNISSRNNEFLNNDFYNIEDSVSPIKTTGKTASWSMELRSEVLREEEQPNFVDLYLSPMVMLYASDDNEPMTEVSFKPVVLNNNNFIEINTKLRNREYDVTISHEHIYTQTYL